MEIRTAKATDAPQIARIHVETWRTAYRGQIPDAVLAGLSVERRGLFWNKRLTEGRGSVFVAEDDGAVAGFCDLMPSRDKDADPKLVAEIVAIYIRPQQWRRGAGKELCYRALAEARQRGYAMVTLWVLASNVGARCFYEAMGFGFDGSTKMEKATDGGDLREVRYRMTI